MKKLFVLILLLVLVLGAAAVPAQQLATIRMGDLLADPAYPVPLPPLPWPPKEDSNSIKL